MLVFKTLENTPLSAIVKVLTVSFADYFVKMPDDVNFWNNRWKTNRVRYDLSIGAFDKADNLVGFMIMGLDTRNDKLVLFNAGTGVIPQFRGRRLVKQMYDHAIPIYQKNSIDELALEVITKNIKAIKAYQSLGFKIDKLYQCFRTNTVKNISVTYRSSEIERPNWEQYDSFTKEYYCWEFLKTGINQNLSAYRYFELFDASDKLIAYYIINPERNTIMRFEAKNEEGYKALYHHWHTEFEKVRIINVQNEEKINFLKQYNFENNIDQFEMVRRANACPDNSWSNAFVNVR